jgi:hypothetical protein
MEDKQIPVFHYTFLDNLDGIVTQGLLPRKKVKKFVDIAISSCEQKRRAEGLLGHVPCYVGYHCWFPGDEFRQFLWDNDYHWRFQNHAFFGSLNKTLRGEFRTEAKYQKIIVLMLREKVVRNFVKAKQVNLYSNIAIRPEREHISYDNEEDFFEKLIENINEKPNGQLDTYCELDFLNDSFPLKLPDAFECILVDNAKVREQVKNKLNGLDLDVIVSNLPRV